MTPRRFFLVAGTLLLAHLFSAAPTFAQQGTISGVVRDEAGNAIADANVVLQGTGIGTITNPEGRFTLTAEPGTYRIEVSFIGFDRLTQSIVLEAGETVTLELFLTSRPVPMEDLVATIGATEVSRVERGHDVELLNVQLELQRAPKLDFSDVINSTVPGVTVTQASGEPGTASQVRVRAATSLTQDNTPLTYLDGIRVSNSTGGGPDNLFFIGGQTTSRLNDINPQDIVSVQVAKGPTAAALYGVEAAAGVLIIETKQGRGDPQYTFMFEVGASYDPNEYRDNYFNLTTFAGATDPNDPRFLQWRPVQNPVTGEVFARDNPLENELTSPFRTAPLGRFFASAGGGGSLVDFYVSGSYDNIQGTLPIAGNEKFSGRVNLTFKPVDELDVVVNTTYINGNTQLAVNNRDIFGWITNATAGLPSTSFGTRPDGSRGDCLSTVLFEAPESACRQEGNLFASFDDLARFDQEQKWNRFIGSTTVRWRPFGWLSQRFVAGVDFIETKDRNFIPRDPVAFAGFDDGFVTDIGNSDENITLDYAATASFDLGNSFSSSTTVGAQYFSSKRETVACSGQGLSSETTIACQSALTFQGASNRIQIKEAGAFLQQFFGFQDYLFATGGVRVDDVSSFGEDQDPIVSPSANLSWVISGMPFWNSASTDLRFRFAWGKAAQAPFPFVADRALQPTRIERDGSEVVGLTTLRPGNPDLSAEIVEEFEIGIDGGFLSNRINYKFTYYDQEITDAILSVPSPPSAGFNASSFVNIGAVQNDGFEATVGGLIFDKEAFAWDASLSAWTSNPIITDLGDQPPVVGCQPGAGRGDTGLFVEGLAPGTLCGIIVESAERDASGDIIEESIVFAPGNVPGGTANLRALGPQEPTNEQTFQTTFTFFGKLRLYALINRRAGHMKFNQNRHFLNPFIEDFAQRRLFSFRQVESSPEEQAMLELGRGLGINSIAVATTSADFTRFRTLSLTYDLPRGFLGTAYSSVTLAAQNLALWTDYEGIDPELRVAGGADTFNGVDFASQGLVRTLTARVSFTW